MRSVSVNGSQVHVLGAVKGLVCEARKVEEAFRRTDPRALAVSVSKEQLAALRSPEACEEYELSPLEAAYYKLMSSFGEVRLPSPSYMKALELASSASRPIIPIDMNDLAYTEFYCDRVGALDLVREGAFGRGVRRKSFDGTSPEALALDWDRRVNKAKGFRQLEMERERHMASVLARMATKHQSILAVVEMERAEGVASLLANGR